jgi:hypothetical protein
MTTFAGGVAMHQGRESRPASDVDVPRPDGPGAGYVAQEGDARGLTVRDAAGAGDSRKGSARPGVPAEGEDMRQDRELDDVDLLWGATAGAALAALCLWVAYHAVMWLAGQPAVFWSRAGAVAVLLVGAGAMAGGLIGLERAGQRREGRR